MTGLTAGPGRRWQATPTAKRMAVVPTPMGEEEHQSDEPDQDRSQYGGTTSDIDATEQTDRAEEATDGDETDADRDDS